MDQRRADRARTSGRCRRRFILLAVAGRLERKAWPYVVCGVLCLLATGGIVFGNGAWIVAAAALQGFSAAAILILLLALPPLLSPPDDVHRVTAAMFTISYSCAVIVPVISGSSLGFERGRRALPSRRSRCAALFWSFWRRRSLMFATAGS